MDVSEDTMMKLLKNVKTLSWQVDQLEEEIKHLSMRLEQVEKETGYACL